MVSVFTPTYNRAYILENLYKSLLRQTSYNFEWIIIDDGSEDRTENLVNSWKQLTKKFAITYKKTSNGGKHRAINYGVTLARYEAFFIVDSDEVLKEDAIEFINEMFGQIVNNDEFAGISGLRIYRNGEIVGGNPCFSDYVDATNLERKKYSLIGDKAEVYKTSVLKRYPFPEFDGETYLTEAVVWDAIAFDGLKIRWYNKPLYYTEYMADGLTRNCFENRKNNPLGWAEWILRERNYGRLDKRELNEAYFTFIESVDLSPNMICKILDISESDYKILHKRKERIMKRIEKEIQSHEIKHMALYGYGYNARRLMEYIKNLKIEILYVIDRNYTNIKGVPAYSLQKDLPQIDSVCITLKEPGSELKNILKRKLPNSYIWQLSELGLDVW